MILRIVFLVCSFIDSIVFIRRNLLFKNLILKIVVIIII